MNRLTPHLLLLSLLTLPCGPLLAERSPYTVGDPMPKPVAEHFVVTFSIKCTETDSARVDRYEHGNETTVIAYQNDSRMPYGYFLVHTSTLLLDNDPQDGLIDSVAVLSLEEDVRICHALPR